MRNPLLDLEFLKLLDLDLNKEIYAKIILLTFDEHPIQEIQGSITQGSINIDGASSVRRTCFLSMVTNNTDINETYWVLKNKFKLEVGVRNNIDSLYPDIIWFKQGLFVFSSINMNVQSNNYTISLLGKDKMCLLNGELGGAIVAETNFGKMDEYKKYGEEIIRYTIDLPIIDIVKNAVHLYAGLPLENIVLNDVEEYGLELLEYRGENDIWMLRGCESQSVENIIINPEQKYTCVYPEDKAGKEYCVDSNLTNGIPVNGYYNLTEINNENTNAYRFEVEGKEQVYLIIRVTFGETCGYRLTDLTYPGELVLNVGESITSLLDKIKNIFSEFEYFFDLDGRFIFLKKLTYVNTSWSTMTYSDKDIYAPDAAYTSSVTYSFEKGILLNSFSNSPQIGDIRNDYSIWGKRKGTSGADLPIHMRYAIDLKPVYYKPVRWETDALGNLVYDKENNLIKLDVDPYVSDDYFSTVPPEEAAAAVLHVDWREIIYQMAKDFYAFDYRIDDFKLILALDNSNYYPTGKTGYEIYYMDMISFWRLLYTPKKELIEKYQDYQKKLEDYKNMEGKTKKEKQEMIESLEKEISNFLTDWQIKVIDENELQTTEFHVNVKEYPDKLDFWFDFLDVDNADLSKYSISAIGNRPKPINDEKIKAIYYKETPLVLFLTSEDYLNLMGNMKDYLDVATGYTFIRLTEQLENFFTISALGKSAQDELESLLYQHTYATETVNLNTVPIYYLQPNNRIFVKDDDTKINGEYIVSKITIPLTYNGTSSITATKAVERIY